MGSEPGGQEAHGKRRATGHIQLQSVVASLQFLPTQHRKVGHDPQGCVICLRENQWGLVLGVRVEPAYGRRKRPIRFMRKLELIE